DATPGAGNSLSGASQLLPALYSLASDSTKYTSNFIDITTGSTGSSTLAKAAVGYDYTTGLGSPKAGSLVTALAGASFSGGTIIFSAAPSSAVVTGAVTPNVVPPLPVVILPISGSFTFFPTPTPTPDPT